MVHTILRCATLIALTLVLLTGCFSSRVETELVGLAIHQIGKPTGDRRFFQKETLAVIQEREEHVNRSVVNISLYGDRKKFVCRGVLLAPEKVVTVLSCLKGQPGRLIVDTRDDFSDFTVGAEFPEKNLVVLKLGRALAGTEPAQLSKVVPMEFAPGFMAGYARNHKKKAKLERRPIKFNAAEGEMIPIVNYKDGFVPAGVPVFDIDGELVGLVEGRQEATYSKPYAISLVGFDIGQ